MDEVSRLVLAPGRPRPVRSLCWQGDDLVDWADGGVRYRLDGSIEGPRFAFGYAFDGAISFPDGRYAVVYDTLGTKGVILKQGHPLRQINRDFYCARAYEYPVALLTLPDGRDAIAHCPEEYRKLEIEEIETGKRLTSREGAPLDFFHSRLRVSPNGQYVLSAGWIWHPLDTMQVYNIERALAEPDSLDQNEDGFPFPIGGLEFMDEIHSAAFLDDDLIMVSGEKYKTEDGAEDELFIGIYSIAEGRLVSKVRVEEAAGTLMPVGARVVGFFRHPKLIDISTGEVIRRWPEIDSGAQNSSIARSVDRLPPLALDPHNRRFAVAGPEAITVVQLG